MEIVVNEIYIDEEKIESFRLSRLG